MSKKIIKKITIDLAGVEVEVTPQQARELHEALTELLGIEAKETVIKHEYYPRWWYGNGTLTVPAQSPTVAPSWPIVWCSSTTGSNALLNTTTDTVKVTIN